MRGKTVDRMHFHNLIAISLSVTILIFSATVPYAFSISNSAQQNQNSISNQKGIEENKKTTAEQKPAKESTKKTAVEQKLVEKSVKKTAVVQKPAKESANKTGVEQKSVEKSTKKITVKQKPVKVEKKKTAEIQEPEKEENRIYQVTIFVPGAKSVFLSVYNSSGNKVGEDYATPTCENCSPQIKVFLPSGSYIVKATGTIAASDGFPISSCGKTRISVNEKDTEVTMSLMQVIPFGFIMCNL